MSLRIVDENIFRLQTEAIVIPVNCQGVAGAGLAAEARALYPGWRTWYQNICSDRLSGFTTGGAKSFVIQDSAWLAAGRRPRVILSVATKATPWMDSKREWVQRGLDNLVALVDRERIQTVAVPALGCGLGKLRFQEIEQDFVDALDWADADYTLCRPRPSR